jgi:catechol 2,3-dioxygenase-like lactoylglutathione lyase family enzyme
VLDHIGLPVSDFERSKAFYTAVLAPLGISLLLEKDLSDEGGPAGYCGFGVDRPQFWIGTGKPFTGPPACCICRYKPNASVGLLQSGFGGGGQR